MRKPSIAYLRSKLLQGALLASGAFALTSCAGGLLPSSSAWMASTPEKAVRWLNECEGNRNDMLRKEAFCTQAIKSQDVFDLDRSFAYTMRGTARYTSASSSNADWDWAAATIRSAIDDFNAALRITPDNPVALENRGNAYLVLGEQRRAEADYRRVAQLTGNRGPSEYARWWQAERERLWREWEASRRWAISYEGIWCGTVQADSIFNQENEIRVQIMVHGDGVQLAGAEKPSSDATYWGATAGYRSTRGAGDIWIGPAQDVDLSVVMWEHDNGGPMVDFASFAAVNIAFAYFGAQSGGAKGYNPGGAGGPLGASDLAQAIAGDAIDDVVSSILKDAFGTHNDHMGTYHWTDLNVDDWAASSTKTENGFTYHIYTEHLKHGANCRTYYRFRELS